jgi:enoyl-CoA hydratase/carnithine racemase
MCEGIVNDIQIPTIGLLHGPAVHTEIALFCDITIASDDVVINDPHAAAGWVPGDGIQIAFREAMGSKRANYAMLTNQYIDATTALDYGLVSEVVPRDRLYKRATEIAESLVRCMPRATRRITTQVLRAPLKQALATELRQAFGNEMFATLVVGASHDVPDIDAFMKSKTP